MPNRQRFSTGNPWERKIGFCRAVRTGKLVFTAGTIAADEDGVVHGADSYEQSCYILDKLGTVLRDAGSGLEHVVRVVCYLKGLEHGPGFMQAHAEYLGDVRPATTCIAIADLFGEGSVVEWELTAVVP